MIKYSTEKNVYCVRPTTHSNLIDVTIWCSDVFGSHKIGKSQPGRWSWCSGNYYGIFYDDWPTIPDTRQYYSFESEDDALLFMMKWT